MRRLLLSILFAASLAGIARAQGSGGNSAEEVKKEILKLEAEKVQAVHSTTGSNPYMTDWFTRVMVNEVAHTGADGKYLTKDQWIGGWNTPQHRMTSMNQFGHRLNVYGDGGDGTTVIVSFINDVSRENNGKRDTLHSRATDVWVKINGAWRIVAVHITPIANSEAKQ